MTAIVKFNYLIVRFGVIMEIHGARKLSREIRKASVKDR